MDLKKIKEEKEKMKMNSKLTRSKEKYSKQSGITLIALVVTIVVLLILAGVSINAVFGDSGIIKKAQDAQNKANESAQKDMEQINELENWLNEKTVGSLTPWSGETADSFSSGNGTEEDPYTIETAEQLAFFASQVNAGETFEGKFISIIKSINLGNKEFTPIGVGPTGETPMEWDWSGYFNGTLDGKGNVITGIKITQPTMHGVGLIGALQEKGTVKNLNIYEGTIIGNTRVGGIIGTSVGKIMNCTNKATIIAQDNENTSSGLWVGGIVGVVEKGNIDNCKNYGNVTAKDDALKTGKGKFAGGIVGQAYASMGEDISISNCANIGTVIATYQQVGGIVGCSARKEGSTNKITIINCNNNGRISTGDSEELVTVLAGGIIGTATGETIIDNCINSGNITATRQKAGGIAGSLESGKGEIKNCTNNGYITTANNGIGGVIGYIGSQIVIDNCINNGNLMAPKGMMGGIVGRQDVGTIKDCTNNGEITSIGSGAGGISGYTVAGTLDNCINNGNITVENQEVGGMVARQAAGTIKNCTNNGSVIAGNQQAGGIIGNQQAGEISNCTNKGEIVSNANNGRGVSGGIVGLQNGGSINSVYNSGLVKTKSYSEDTIDALGGIVGLQQNTGVISKAYNKGQFEGGDVIGGIVGQKNLSTTVENSYYYAPSNTELKGIGSETDTNTEIVKVEDVSGKAERTEKDISSLEDFLNQEM